MSEIARAELPDLSGRRVLVPGGTGGVGEGVVRAHLAAGAHVVVPTRSESRAARYRDVLADVLTGTASARLHLVVHDYTTFAGAEQLADEVVGRLGGLDAVVAPIGGWWAGRRPQEIDEADWRGAFVELATTHMAVARACLPRMGATGAYTLVVGESASSPVPGSGLVSMEQAALLMMQRALQAEAAQAVAAGAAPGPRVFALVLGAVRTPHVGSDDPGASADHVSAEQGSADQVGAVAAAASAATAGGRELRLRDRADVDEALALLRARPDSAPVLTAAGGAR